MAVTNATDPGDRPAEYALGHTERELERLGLQARLVDPVTRRFFLAAGILPGMRVLDVGSGAGDVAMLAAEIVGSKGEVVGSDPAAAALVVARDRAAARSLHSVSFHDGDPAEMAFERPFDAIVGRYVLMFLPDPAAALRKLSRHLRPGGVVVFHEVDWFGARSYPPVPTYDKCCRWVDELLRLRGADTRMGVKLHSVFVAAGLPAPSMRMEECLGGGAASWDPMFLAAELVGTLLPQLEQSGIATAAEVDLETLASRMRKEAIATGSVVARHSEVGAWVRLQ